MAQTLPITKLVMPSTLKGQQNGKLAEHLLVPIGVGNARMEKTAARSFIAMFSEARKAGFEIRHVGDYRPYATQLSMFLSRYEPVGLGAYTVTPPARRKIWEDGPANGHPSKYWVKKKIGDSYPATAATPGNSNHGWGLALDIAEEYNGQPGPDAIRQVFVNWLCNNAARYGISAELQSEPWHWRYVAGDKIPSATLAAENNTQSVPIVVANSTPNNPLAFAYPGQPIQNGSRGVAAQLVQAVIGAKQDGWFGPQSVSALKAWQTSKGLTPTGVCDEPVWKTMFP
jgi:peptidoglycan hydrolase-like protein with peptidoglycan-binding domain